MNLSVRILGSGSAAQKHRAAFAALPFLYTVIDGGSPDIVSICTANYAHYWQAYENLESCDVIVEKPVCGSLAEMDSLMRRSVETGKTIHPVFQYRFAGHATVVNDITTEWWRTADWYDGWWGDPHAALGGCLISHGIHSIDLMIQEHGMPSEIETKELKFVGAFSSIEISASLLLHWGDTLRRITTIVLNGAPPPPVRATLTAPRFDLGDSFDGYVNQFRQIHASVTDWGLTPPVTATQARQALEVLTGAYYSWFTKEPVLLPLAPEHPFHRGWTAPLLLRRRLNRSYR